MDVNSLDSKGSTPLHWAAYLGFLKILFHICKKKSFNIFMVEARMHYIF